jgi:hypoxanthine phosphoribosyltransferase
MNEATIPPELAAVRANARRLADPGEINRAVDRMASSITEKLSRTNPLLLTILTGGIVPLTMLLQRLEFPLQVDYTHLTRYGMRTTGGELRWVKKPPQAVKGRTVLVIDDLLDHGITLSAVVDECERLGAEDVLTAVLVTKDVNDRAGLKATDFSALVLPDEYLFGFGMDYKSYLRNAAGIFAVNPDA